MNAEPGEKHIIIGTAGHVDHGKTQLVKRLTGIDTDRLKEEKERGISIELGFAPLRLPSGLLAGLVDVPGHERFVKHMLAGASGIDLVLLVVAADEGVMPQTREHLDIIHLLGIPRGLIVITKKDLVDEELLLLVEEEVRETVQGTILAEAPLLAVSALTGEGIPELLAAIDQVGREVREKEAAGRARLPIDRVFSITGFGTVVTGTLFSGRLRVGTAVEILPEGLTSRIRTLQVHGHKVDTASAGQRVAVNLSGLAVADIDRGSVLAEPGWLQPSFRLDVHLELLPHVAKPLKNWTRVRFHLGTKEALGRVLLLEAEELEAGRHGYAQLVMEEPVVADRRDRFVLRAYSPMVTIGGGSVIDPVPPKRKRFQEEVIAGLATRERGTPEEILLQYLLQQRGLVKAEEAESSSGLSSAELEQAVRELAGEERIIRLTLEGQRFLVHPEVYVTWQEELRELLEQFHRQHPLRAGISKEEVRSRLFKQIPVKTFNALLQIWGEQGGIEQTGQILASHGFRPHLPQEQQAAVERLLAIYEQSGWQPPSWLEAAVQAGIPEREQEEVLAYLLQQRRLIKMADDLLITAERLAEGKRQIEEFLQQQEAVTIAEARDLLGSSRKVVLPLLEYLDREKVTRRVGDKRVRF